MSLESSALASLALMKEFAGQQRAMVAQALVAGKLDEELRARIHQADAKQVGILNLLSETYKGAYQDQLHEMSKTPAFDQFEAMRKVVLSTAAGTSIQGIEPDAWFKTASARIDELRKFENLLASGVKEQSILLADEAWNLVLIWLSVGRHLAGDRGHRLCHRAVHHDADRGNHPDYGRDFQRRLRFRRALPGSRR